MSDAVCRWGILSTAGIARKNWQGIRLSGNGRVAAVASRKREAAEAFIGECQAEVPHDPRPEAVEGYEALLARDDIDAVYVPLPTAMRREWVLRAAEAGKHVLCEKPCGSSTAEVREMIDACREHNVQFMDGVMFMHSGRLEGLRAAIDDAERVGRLRRIHSHFTFNGDEDFRRENIRVVRQLEPFGCLGDLGWYNLRFTLWVMGFQLPTAVRARQLATLRGSASDGPVPGELSAELDFEGGVTASFYCSFLTGINQFATISGEHGYVAVDDFVLPFYGCEVDWTRNNHVFEIDNCQFNMRRHTERQAIHEYSNGEQNAQETNLFRRFGQLVAGGRPDPYWGEIALKTQAVMDACAESARQDGAAVAVAL